MLLRVFVDVSGKLEQHRVITAAAYIASDDEIERFNRIWKATLDLAQIPFFHANEFFACRGKPFRHLRRDSEEHRRAAALFALAAYSSFQQGYGYSVDTRAYATALDRVFRTVQTPHDRLPPPMLAVARIGSMAWRTAIGPGGHQAEMLLEQGDGVGEIIDWLRHLKSVGEPWTKGFTDFRQVSGDEYAVQAADLLAYEAWLESTRVIENRDRSWSDIDRDTFKLITTGSGMQPPAGGTAKVTLDYAAEEHLRASAPQFATFLAKNPSYRRPPWYRGWRRKLRLWLNAHARSARKRIVGRIKRLWYGHLGFRPRGRTKRHQRRGR